MFKKLLIILLFFYLFILLQNSFLIHYGLFGLAPDLVFILFFLLIFFSSKILENLIYAVIAGTLLDLSWYNYLGPSIIFFIIILFLLKKTQSALNIKKDGYPFTYFLTLFLFSFIIYQIMSIVYLWLTDANNLFIIFNIKFLIEIIYNSLFASFGFWIFKKIEHVKRI